MPLNVKSKVKKSADDELMKLQMHLRKNVFPYMSDDELLKFMIALKKWTIEMVGSNG